MSEPHEIAPVHELVAELSEQFSGEQLAALSEWIDRHNAHKPEQQQLWERTAKVGEEFGEVVAEMILLTNQNPRKPAPDDEHEVRNRVIDELLDVAVTALGAVEHMIDNTGSSLAMLRFKIHLVHERALGAKGE